MRLNSDDGGSLALILDFVSGYKLSFNNNNNNNNNINIKLCGKNRTKIQLASHLTMMYKFIRKLIFLNFNRKGLVCIFYISFIICFF